MSRVETSQMSLGTEERGLQENKGVQVFTLLLALLRFDLHLRSVLRL